MGGHSVRATLALTKREQEVLELMALGLANKAIAQRLSLSSRTVEAHVDHILDKLKAPSRTRAIIEAGRAGLLGADVADVSDQPNQLPLQLRAQRLVGRGSELAALHEHLRSAVAGKGSLILIGGEAGSGKSRLLAEFCSSIAPELAQQATGQCHEYAQAPLAPFLSAFTTLADQSPNSLRSRSLPRLEGLDTLEQFNALAEFLARATRLRPLVLILEDAHWADSASLDLLLHLSPSLADSRVLLLVTHRSEELSRGHPLRSLLPKLERNRNVIRCQLGPLSNAEINVLLDDAMAGRRSLSATTLNAICANAEGNPLFAEELLKNALASDSPADGVPATLREAILDRLRTLDESDRTTLVHAAALGRRFDAQFLTDVVGRPIARVLATLKRAIDLQLIVEETGDAALFSFRHELTRQAIYGDLLEVEARPLHHRIAVALESVSADDHVAELAYHYWMSHERDKAVSYNERAGDQAAALFAFRDAILSYERALDAGLGDPLRVAGVQEKLASASFSAGFGERAMQLRETVLACYENLGDRQRTAAACLQLARTMALLGDPKRQEMYAERALRLIHDDAANPVFFDAQVALMDVSVRWRWRPQEVRKRAAIAERSPGFHASTSLIQFYELRWLMHVALGETAEAFADAQRASALAQETGDSRSALRVWGNYTSVMARAGERAAALEGSARALEIIRQKRITGLTTIWTLAELAFVALLHGDLRTAQERIADARSEVIEGTGFRLSLARVAIVLGLALDDERLTRMTNRDVLTDLALGSGNAYMIGSLFGFATLYFARDKTSAGQHLLTRAIEALESIDSFPPTDTEELLLLVAQRGDQADVPRARAILERIASSSSVRSTAAYQALSEAYEQLRFGDRKRGAQQAHVAAQAFHAMGWPLHEARALEAAGDKQSALECYKQVGAHGDFRRLVQSAGLAGATDTDEMTARERQVFELLLQGSSNRAIAHKLSLGERTIATHVSSILMKAGVASRAELIAKSGILRGGDANPHS